MAEKENKQGQNLEETEDSRVANPKPIVAPNLIQGQNKEEAEVKQVTNPVPRVANPRPTEAPNLIQQRLAVEQQQVTESYMSCARQFYTLQEMIKFMTANNGVTKQSVTRVFAEMMKGQNAAAYLRVSEQRSLERKKTEDERLEVEALLQRFGSGSVAGSSAPSQSDGASSSSSSSRRRRRR